MTDGVIKGAGNSRYLKSVSNFKTLYPTYDDFVAALVAGTLPIDLKGINSSGWSTQGTPLTKANLLTDSTAALYGYGSTATVNLVLSSIKNTLNTFPTASKISMVESGSVTITSTGQAVITTTGTPVFLVLFRTDVATLGTLKNGNYLYFITPPSYGIVINTPNAGSLNWAIYNASFSFNGKTTTVNIGNNHLNVTFSYVAFSVK